MSDGYVKSFRELIDETPWERYGSGRDPRCNDCMVHCGYEATAVTDATSSFKNMLHALKPLGNSNAAPRPPAAPKQEALEVSGAGR